MATLLGPFQIAIHRWPSGDDSTPSETQTPHLPFVVSFEEVFAALENWPRMYIEPDGSFVWVGEEVSPDGLSTAWQLDGHLYDRAGRLLFVELQGTCPVSAFEQLLCICQLPVSQATIELRRVGQFLDCASFIKQNANY